MIESVLRSTHFNPVSLFIWRGYVSGLQKIVFVGGVALFTIGCNNGGDDVVPTPIEKKLVDSTKLFDLLATTANFLSKQSGYLSNLPEFSYDAEVYKITYNTTYKNKPIVASGVVAIPDLSDPVAMLSWQHGTIAHNDDAPSAGRGIQDFQNNLSFAFSLFACYGVITAIPDYIGFGSTAEVVHPYIVEDVTATTVTDMLLAAREFALEKKLSFNKKVLLAGYSEGGYATMATHKYMEENKSKLPELNLVASFPAAGGYDVKGMQEHFFSLNTGETYFMANLAYAYKVTYDWKEPLSDFFKEPYASAIPGLLDGTKDVSQVQMEITYIINDFLNPHFKENIETDPKYSHIVEALNENSLTDWKPTVKMYMYQGLTDTLIPPKNSSDVYKKLIANGASPDIVTLTEFEDKNHSTAITPYLEDFVPKAIELK